MVIKDDRQNTSSQGETLKFYTFSKEEYDVLTTIAWLICETIFLIGWCIFIYYEFVLGNIYLADTIFIDNVILFAIWGSYMIFYFFNSISTYFKRKRTLSHYTKYREHKEKEISSPIKEESFCVYCGEIITSDIFKKKKKEYVKPTKFAGLSRGYFCKPCYKKKYLSRNLLMRYALFVIYLITMLVFLFNMYSIFNLPSILLYFYAVLIGGIVGFSLGILQTVITYRKKYK